MKRKNHLAKTIRVISWRLPRGIQGKKKDRPHFDFLFLLPQLSSPEKFSTKMIEAEIGQIGKDLVSTWHSALYLIELALRVVTRLFWWPKCLGCAVQLYTWMVPLGIVQCTTCVAVSSGLIYTSKKRYKHRHSGNVCFLYASSNSRYLRKKASLASLWRLP